MTATRFAPAGPLLGTLRPPADKSISHRAALIGAMAEGETEIEGFLRAEDTLATLAAVRALGAEAGEPSSAPGGPPTVTIRGIGLRGPGERAADGPTAIDVRNAGTLLRMLPGWLAGQRTGSWTLDGDESIRRRPVDRVAEPLRLMGAAVSCREDRLPPLKVEGGRLDGIKYELPVASAQVKSCVLLAGLLADDQTEVLEPAPTRDHTERMLSAAGAELEIAERTRATRSPVPKRITIQAADRLEPAPISIPGDFSSAAFQLVAAVLVPGSEVRLERVGLNPTRIGLLGILHRMGASVEVQEEGAPSGEPRGTITARHGPLAATRVTGGEVPLAIDELPLVGLLGCFADGETVVAGAEELRHKESDRIAALTEGLAAIGAEVEAREDGFAVQGTGGLRGGRLDAQGDHRLAMLGAVAGLASQEGVEVAGMEVAAVSYPRFEGDLASLLRR